MAHLIINFPDGEGDSIEDERTSDVSSESFHFSSASEDGFLLEDGDERGEYPTAKHHYLA